MTVLNVQERESDAYEAAARALGSLCISNRAPLVLSTAADFLYTTAGQTPDPCTLQPAPCTLHSAPCTLHPESCTLHPAPCTLHPAPCTLNPKTKHYRAGEQNDAGQPGQPNPATPQTPNPETQYSNARPYPKRYPNAKPSSSSSSLSSLELSDTQVYEP